MDYYLTKFVDLGFDESVQKITEELKKVGFGILTEIDVKQTFKNKINADFRDYKILGACNPKFAYEVLQAENKAGVLLPCSVVIQKHDNNQVEISIMDLVPLMRVVNNPTMNKFAEDVKVLLSKALGNC
ncbi:MAG: DUF302 domain-containing protein [bacterium]